MSVLDDPSRLAAGDPSGALDALAGFGEQVRAAVALADGASPLPGDDVRSVVFCGMGGSAIGGDAVAALAHAAGPVPVAVHRGYGAPAYAGPSTFVVASSYSGGTEETLDAARAAFRAGAPGLAVAGGGALAEEAAARGWAVVRVPGGLMPRYALGTMTAAPVAFLERAGLLRPEDGWRASVPALLERRAAQWGPDRPAQDNVAKALAHELDGAFPVIWGGEGVTAVAAARWKADVNENAKTFAHAAALPEANHNEIVGWAREGADGRPAGRRVLVCLRDPHEDPRVGVRFTQTVREVEAAFDTLTTVLPEGDGPLGRFFDLALLGGFVTCYLGILRGVDPSPIDSIARLKAALAGRT